MSALHGRGAAGTDGTGSLLGRLPARVTDSRRHWPGVRDLDACSRQEHGRPARRLRAQPRHVQALQLAIADYHAPVNEHIAHAGRGTAPDELPRQVPSRYPPDLAGVEDYKIGGLADLNGADLISHADRARPVNRRQSEGFVRAQRVALLPVTLNRGQEVGGMEHIRRVAGVVGVTAQGDPAAAAHELTVPAVPSVTLGEPQVRARAGRDRGSGADNRLQLIVIDMDGVSEHKARSQHPEPVQVHDRALTAAFEIGVGVPAVWRHVPGESYAEPVGEFTGGNEQLV